MIYIMLFCLCYFVLPKATQIKEKRLIISAAILGSILSLFEIVGYSINNYLDLSGIIESPLILFKNILKFLGYFVLFYNIIIMLFSYLDNRVKNKEDKDIKFFSDNKKLFFLIWGIIFLAWIPYFLRGFPGILTDDSLDQIMQAIGNNEISNHHPVFHTFIISIFLNIGNTINNLQLGVVIYSIFQMLLLSGIFSFSIYYMAKKNINKVFRILALVFYALYPVNAIYSITMWKDIPFAASMVLFTTCMMEIADNSKDFLKSKRKNVLFIISILLIILFRNNGIYVFVLTIPFLFIFNRRYCKRLLIIFLICISFYMLLKGPIFSILNIKQGSAREALSIPLQQFARVVKYREDDLTEEEKQSIYKFLPVDNLGSIYYPRISDNVKINFADKEFKENKLEFVTTWIKLFFKFPKEYIESFLCNSYGYWYPEARHWIVGNGIVDNEIGITEEPLIEKRLIEGVRYFVEERNIPIISMFFSIGFAFWLILTAFVYCIYKKKYQLICVYIPIMALWLTTLASPVFAEYRYIYAFFTCLPLLLTVATDVASEVKDREEYGTNEKNM